MKLLAPLNIFSMLVTLEVSRGSGWLKLLAPQNMPLIVFTDDVSQSLIAALKCAESCKHTADQEDASQKRCDMSVTAETSQVLMCPCAVSAVPSSASHSATPVSSCDLLVNTDMRSGPGAGT